MKNLMIVFTAAATLAVAAPAMAQVHIEAGPAGVGVGVGDGRPHHGHWRRGYAYEGRHCRTERTEVTTPSGRVVVKTRKICD